MNYGEKSLIDYPYELTTHTSRVTTSKLMWNGVISAPGEQYV